MKFEYTTPEIEITLFATESIMESGTTSSYPTVDAPTGGLDISNTFNTSV